MSQAPTIGNAANPIATLDHGTSMAIDRTRLALERTLMAWIRTATSLITFGFTVYKFFQFEMKAGQMQEHALGPREYALIMISIGVIALVLATLQHLRETHSLRVQYPGALVPRSLSFIVSGSISMLGIFALIAVLYRL